MTTGDNGLTMIGCREWVAVGEVHCGQFYFVEDIVFLGLVDE